jgi:hypothetical protein
MEEREGGRIGIKLPNAQPCRSSQTIFAPDKLTEFDVTETRPTPAILHVCQSAS